MKGEVGVGVFMHGVLHRIGKHKATHAGPTHTHHTHTSHTHKTAAQYLHCHFSTF